MIRAIHHIAISTPNLTRSVEFYTSQLGFEVAGGGQWRDSEALDRHMGLRSSAGRTATLRLGAAMLEIFEFESPPSAPTAGDRPVSDHGLTHICLDVTDLDAEYERLRAAGMRFHAPPLDADVMKVRSVYGRDPDGNVIELQQILDESSPMAVSETVSD
jgi:catechol 2,3-dioxygenase-like lactoylglutathione lyase family enzyme